MKAFTIAPRALCTIAAIALVAPAFAQDAPAPYHPPRATSYASLAELPDLTGIWYPDWTQLFGQRRIPPKLTPEAQAKLDAWNAKYKDTGPPLYAQAHCLPPGMPGVMQQPYPIEISYQPGRVTIYAEAYEQTRWIYTDGRPLPADPDAFFNGNSVGHWEGDTLVIETVGFSPETSIGPGIDHSDQMKIDERFWLEKPGVLMEEMSITDPKVLMEPYVIRQAFKLDDQPLREYVCAENNRLESSEDGANIDLKLDGEDDPFAGF